MKNIYLFITSLSQGGAERQIVHLGESLNSIGYSITLVTYIDLPDHYLYSDKIQRIKIAPKASRLTKVLHIWKLCLNIPTDSILISFEERNNFLVSFPLLFKSRIKLIVSERNYQLNNGSFKNFLRKIFYRRADYIIPNSHSQGDFLKKLLPQFSHKISVIHNFTDTDKFHPANSYNNSIPRKLCIFARFDLQKNYIRFVDAIRLVKLRSPYHFIIDWYGKTTDINGNLNEHYIRFRELIDQNELNDTIHLHDAIACVEELMPNYSAFLLPSLFEGFSNSLSEAISCGLPCLVSNVSDNRLMVKDNYNGWLFNPLDTQSISDTIIRFLDTSTEVLNQFSNNSRNLALELFNQKSFISKYLHLISHE